MRVMFSILIVVLVINPFAVPGKAQPAECTPRADYWFLEAYEINSIKPALPIEIQVDLSPMDRRGYLRITNSGEGLLYLLPRDAYADVVVESRGLDISDALADEDQVSQTVFLVDLVPAHASAAIETGQELVLDIDNIPRLVDDRLEDHNILTESWSSFIVIPPPLRTELYLVYGEQIYEITFTIRYRLNMGFEGKNCSADIQPIPTRSIQVYEETATDTYLGMWILGGLAVYFLGVMLLAVRKLRTTR